MCVKPIYIRNKKIDFDIHIDKSHFYVPCGHCVQCRDYRSQGYLFRALAEFCYGNWNCFYLTLTYSDDNLTQIYSDVTSCFYPIFDTSVIPNFVKRLRYYFGDNFHYLITNELGGLNGRPHHHALIYVSKNLTTDDFHKAVKSSWNFGFIEFGKDKYDNGLVRSVSALRYVVKYINKSSEYLDIPDDLKQAYGDCFCPRLTVSNGFGLSVLPYLTDKHYTIGKYDFVKPDNFNAVRFEKSIRLSIPLYIYRKRYYKLVKNSNNTYSYDLTKDGYFMKLRRLISIFNYTYEKFKTLRVQINDLIDLLTKNFSFLGIRPVDYTVLDLSDENLYNLAFFRTFLVGTSFSNSDFDLNVFLSPCIHKYNCTLPYDLYIELKAISSSVCVKSLLSQSPFFKDDLYLINALQLVLDYQDYKVNFYNDKRSKILQYDKLYKKEKSILTPFEYYNGVY